MATGEHDVDRLLIEADVGQREAQGDMSAEAQRVVARDAATGEVGQPGRGTALGDDEVGKIHRTPQSIVVAWDPGNAGHVDLGQLHECARTHPAEIDPPLEEIGCAAWARAIGDRREDHRSSERLAHQL